MQNKYTLSVRTDVNDGDIRTRTHTITGDAEMNEVIRLFKCLNKHSFGSSYDWDVEEDDYTAMEQKYADVLSEDEIEILAGYIGTCDVGYCRSVESVKYTPIANIFTIL